MRHLLAPFYEHPTTAATAWKALERASHRLYGVILNPANGPGTAPDPAFATAAARLRETGTRVLGYVDTDYARRPHADVVRDLLNHRDWYGVTGAFFDQVSSGPEAVPHYRRLAVAARAADAGSLVLNHGTHPDPAYLKLAELLVTFEGTWQTYRTAEQPPPWTVTYPPDRFCHLVYAAPADADVAALAAERGAAVHCAVPGEGPHPWGTLPHGVGAVTPL
ncbi:spherulation-specific family 4 protein [Streptomyces sp. NBC_00237]|uniref:spherulation-specific family 4 protein n=1 Tax=Streptomyces sp. NBC_00237 TaxID=2975687 RepID=UPI002257111C|nr:spherulation-specific family 4 protein [Streptomyces sp. NBC_00237]MCX5201685.1 spherulation-specific family 4 protein [Streptomyces sp. NBC_00237]